MCVSSNDIERYAVKRNCVYFSNGMCFGIGCNSGGLAHGCPVVGLTDAACAKNSGLNGARECITQADGERRLGINITTGARADAMDLE